MQCWHLNFSYNMDNYFLAPTMCWINCWRYNNEQGTRMCHLVAKRNNKQGTVNYIGHTMMEIYNVMGAHKGGSCLLRQGYTGKATLKEEIPKLRLEELSRQRGHTVP